MGEERDQHQPLLDPKTIYSFRKTKHFHTRLNEASLLTRKNTVSMQVMSQNASGDMTILFNLRPRSHPPLMLKIFATFGKS